MRNYYALNPGEFFAAEEIAKHRKDLDLYLPLKDKGVDLLAVEQDANRSVRIQVKESRSYEASGKRPECAWHQLRNTKLAAADVFVFVVYAVNRRDAKPAFSKEYVIVPRKALESMCGGKRASKGKYDFFFNVDDKRVRDFRDMDNVIDFSRYLNAWHLI